MESRSTARFDARTKLNMELNCFKSLLSYCCDTENEKGVSGIHHGLSVRRPIVCCLSTLKDTRKHNCMTSRTMTYTFQARVKLDDHMSCLPRLGSNITVEEWRSTRGPAKEVLREIWVSEWTPFMESPQHLQGEIRTSAQIIVQVEPLHIFHLSKVRLLKKRFHQILGKWRYI